MRRRSRPVVWLILAVTVGCSSTARTAPAATGPGATSTAVAETTAPPTPTTTTTSAPTTTTVPPHLGSTIIVPDSAGATLTLLSYAPVTAAESLFGLKPGQVEVTVKGCSGSTPISFNPLFFDLIDSENDKVQADLGGSRSQIDSSDVAPGDCVKGSVAFTLGPGLTGKALEFSTALGELRARWSLAR